VSPPPNLTALGKLKWSYELLLNPRGIGTRWQSKKIPPFSAQDPNYVPPKLAFVVQRLARALLAYLVYKLLVVAREIYDSSLQDGDYNEEKERIIRRLAVGEVSMREIWIRAWMPVDFTVTAHCIYETTHNIVSAIAVVLGGRPQEWPPLLGDITEVFSLRQFWG
jgi:hypothetical protein